MSARFVRFVGVGLLNTAFGYLVFGIAIVLGLLPEIALLLATCLGVIFNFYTTGRFVFGARRTECLPRFIIAYVVIYGVNTVALRALINAGISALYSQLLLMPFVVVLTFLIMKFFVFPGKKE
jgi:putative flippase GtrA